MNFLKPYLISNKIDQETIKHILNIYEEVAGMWDNLNNHIPFLSKLFLNLSQRYTREKLCNTFETWSNHIKSLKTVVTLLYDLNSYSKQKLYAYDHDTRLKASAKINEEIHSQLDPLQLLPIIYNYLFFMNDDGKIFLKKI